MVGRSGFLRLVRFADGEASIVDGVPENSQDSLNRRQTNLLMYQPRRRLKADLDLDQGVESARLVAVSAGLCGP